MNHTREKSFSSKVTIVAERTTTHTHAPTNLAPDVIHAFTDGACLGNPGPAGCGVVLVYNGRCKEFACYLGRATNNIAELSAIEQTLDVIKDRTKSVRIYADSTYAIGVLTAGWKIRANHALIERIQAKMAGYADLTLEKIAGHAGVMLNERADALARQAIRQAQSRRGTHQE